jgi:putative copper export protein
MKTLLVVAILVLGFATIGMPVISALMNKHPERQERIARWGIRLQTASGIAVFWLVIIAAILGKL